MPVNEGRSGSSEDRIMVKKVEELMEETMSKYDPSHDALHGKYFILISALMLNSVRW